MKQLRRLYPDQIVPLSLTAVVCLAMVLLLHGLIRFLNTTVVSRETIQLLLRGGDIAIGVTIYLKTSIDFAIYIGRLMSKYPGWKNRIMIEIGTALGNAVGTFGVLIVWDIFREVKLLMAAMILLAALVLLRLAEEGMEHVRTEEGKYRVSFWGLEVWFEKLLHTVNRALAPVLDRLVPNMSMKAADGKGKKALFVLSFTVPFILGMDDFAGYIPLFNVVNVYGFGAGVFLGHMILNIFLFLSPSRTISAVKQPLISFLGSIAFVGLALWGAKEALALIGLLG